MRKHCHSRLCSYKLFEALCGGNCDCCKLFRCRILIQTAVTEYKCSVFSHITVRYYHDTECGYKLCSRFRLENLQTRTKCVSCRMACSGNHSVCVAHLYHHYSVIWIVGQKKLSCLFLSHTFFLS